MPRLKVKKGHRPQMGTGHTITPGRTPAKWGRGHERPIFWPKMSPKGTKCRALPLTHNPDIYERAIPYTHDLFGPRLRENIHGWSRKLSSSKVSRCTVLELDVRHSLLCRILGALRRNLLHNPRATVRGACA